MMCVFIDVVIWGKNDLLVGFKENVIIGKIILVGMGMGVYCNIKFKEVSVNIGVIDGVIIFICEMEE